MRSGRNRKAHHFRRTGWSLWLAIPLSIAGCSHKNEYIEPPPPEVTVVRPVVRDVTDYIEATGTTESVLSVEIRARVRGFLKECLVKEGARVKEGELLLVIDEGPFRVELDQAKAKFAEAEIALKKAKQSQSREIVRAQLKLDESQLNVALTEEKRTRSLVATRAISQEEMDRAEANRIKNAAQVAATKANLTQVEADYATNIAAAEANVQFASTAVRTAEIDLGYCRITAPISGRIGRILHDVGNLVGDGQATLLTTVVKYDVIHVYTTLNVADFLKFRKAATASQTAESQPPTIELALADEPGYQHSGQIDYYDPEVDKGTGTIGVRGVFPNPRGKILPGMFVRIRIPIASRSNALLVPEQSLGIDQSGQYLLVVNQEDKVDYRQVKTGQVDHGMRVVEGEIGAKDRVIVEGLLRARPLMKVVPHFETPQESSPPRTADARPAMKSPSENRPQRGG
jgi:membrane fusion protein (multidrug efflux system)